MGLHPVVSKVTQRIVDRSKKDRKAYLGRLQQALEQTPHRQKLSCGNLAHGFAACNPVDKRSLKSGTKANIAIVSAYNDMLSAHQPLQSFPEIIKDEARKNGATAQFAGGVPAMCDGVTQGQVGMELSLFSREIIAMATAVSLSHNMFDGVLCLGVCDKIVPGLLIGALSFGHLPAIFVPAGPMRSGLPNPEKARIRQEFAAGKIDRKALLDAESKSYHSPGTCTFYGTANSNQLLMEFMGLHLPGSSFVNPGTPIREALTRAATRRILEITALTDHFTPLGHVIDERSLVNGIVGLLASGGSTNHTLHIIAIGQAAGIRITWDDFADLSAVTPLMCRIYPNGTADVNHFRAAGGIQFMMKELLNGGFIHEDVTTVAGPKDSGAYTFEPFLESKQITWRPGPKTSLDQSVLRPLATPFRAEGGLKLLKGNLGRSVIKVSAVKPEHLRVLAPAAIFHGQEQFLEAFKAGDLDRDLVAVVRFQGPEANGMPELHKLSPSLGVLQDKGFQVALVTDGRMSGASGKVPAAIHVTPESSKGGPLAKLRDGDMVLLDAQNGILEARVEAVAWQSRVPVVEDLKDNQWGMGRELFKPFRIAVNSAETGASVFNFSGTKL